MFDIQCAGCHVEKGFNDLAPLVKGWTEEMTEFNLNHLHELKHFMPPVTGTPDERKALVFYLMSMNRRAEAIPGGKGPTRQ